MKQETKETRLFPSPLTHNRCEECEARHTVSEAYCESTLSIAAVAAYKNRFYTLKQTYMSSTTLPQTTSPAIAGNTLLADAVFHPILFSTPMVYAINEGRKNITRRIITERNSECTSALSELDFNDVVFDGKEPFEYLKVARKHDGTRHRLFFKHDVGNIYWVRETWQYVEFGCEPEERGYVYKASENGRDWQDSDENWKWKPSLFMPKEACRLFLQITKIRAERIQDISEEDAINEGVSRYPKSPIYGYKNYLDDDAFCLTAKQSFETLWKKINGEKSWEENPFVWVINLKVADRPNGFC